MAKANVRRNPRVFCWASGVIQGPNGPIKGVVRHLSRGGAFFLATPLLPVGKTVEMFITLPSGPPARVVGEIHYHYRYPEGQGMGVRFVGVEDEHVARIVRYIATLLVRSSAA